jgi:hypothetical protein
MLFITIGLAVVLSFAAPHKVQASVISSPGAGTFDIKAGDSRLQGLDKGATVPEPSSLALILAGALTLLLPKVIGVFFEFGSRSNRLPDRDRWSSNEWPVARKSEP